LAFHENAQKFIFCTEGRLFVQKLALRVAGFSNRNAIARHFPAISAYFSEINYRRELARDVHYLLAVRNMIRGQIMGSNDENEKVARLSEPIRENLRYRRGSGSGLTVIGSEKRATSPHLFHF
jgi:hypothetical protein